MELMVSSTVLPVRNGKTINSNGAFIFKDGVDILLTTVTQAEPYA